MYLAIPLKKLDLEVIAEFKKKILPDNSLKLFRLTESGKGINTIILIYRTSENNYSVVGSNLKGVFNKSCRKVSEVNEFIKATFTRTLLNI